MPAPYAEHLEANDFFSCFSDGVFSARVHHNKPEPAIFALAAQRFGHAPQDLVFLDDHEPNVHAARAAGWQALHFSNAAQAEAALRVSGWY
jgi:putative hydrolase of the HAD superfamily